MQLMARAAGTGSNFFLFSFFNQIRIFAVLRQQPVPHKPLLREDIGTVKKTGISVNQVFLGNFFEFLSDCRLEIPWQT
jgi:hypothetical protein